MSPAAAAAAASTRSKNITSNKYLNVSGTDFHISGQLFGLFAGLLSANVLSGKARMHIYLH